MNQGKQRIELIIIDPQNDFCDPASGTLYVPGAERDAQRIAGLIRRIGDRLDAVHVTLDHHHRYDIGHPLFWVDGQGRRPVVDIPAGKYPIVLSEADLVEGRWRPADPAMADWTLAYARQLAAGGRYAPVIWPYHCLIGEPGSNLYPPVARALAGWEMARPRAAEAVIKGSNSRTEHYSAIQAEVVDPEDPATGINQRLIEALRRADLVAVCGQALSHCVANTVRDIAAQLHPEEIAKLVLLEDAASNVPGFEHLGEGFVREMTARGMRVARAGDFLA